MESCGKHEQFQCCFQEWMNQQHEDLDELLHAIDENPLDNENLSLQAEKGIDHFQKYHSNRALLARHDAPSFLSPSWCTSFENAFHWIGGCRPSLSIGLVYAICGSELDEANLEKFLRGEKKGDLGDISAHQLNFINSLHCETVKEEDKLSKRMASLQEDITDYPLEVKANRSRRLGKSRLQDVNEAMEAHSVALAGILVDADKLRLSTLKELMSFLTPFQSVDLLVAAKKLHLSMHEWAKRRDQQQQHQQSSAPSSG